MTDPLNMLDTMASQLVAAQDAPTAGGIRETIATIRMLPIFGDVSDEDVERLARDLEERIGISMGIGAIVTDQDFRPWLSDAKADGLIDPYYWNRYKKLLQSQRLPGDVITATDTVTDSVLDRMGNPNDRTAWDRKGMVVGHVQSGKTANYTGLVCKAADAGYRLIVVIAGIHNNLRNQTQGRIDEGFIGRDTGRLEKRDTRDKPRAIGVGAFDDRRAPVSLTTTLKDFNKSTATSNTSQIASYAVPVVLVIKKNHNTLRNLIDWLKEHSTAHGSGMVDQPMLLIDDEADNASINIAYGKEEVARINGQIRNLLGLFSRSCYVGYTATPFANIFIDPDTEDEVYKQDLFPRHFIIGLDAPSNYFGARKVFIDGVPDEEEGGRPAYLRYIDDHEDLLPVKHKIHHTVRNLPPSMVDALKSFLVARTIRNLRGQKDKHASMLVNASRFTGVQNLIRNRLHEVLKTIEDAVRVDGAQQGAAERNPEIAELKRCWQEEYADAWPDWDEICENLLPVVASASVVAVNSQSPGSLDYDSARENGLTVIAVGGFSLSRGLTLEGLTVSYFLRNSMMYDTLMQMGRWFGYRPHYEDLCRVWMLREAASWYAHIGEATEELQSELKRMQQADATPEEFGLAVRSHPSALMVTARNKMGSGEKQVMVGLSNSFVETSRLSADPDVLDRNRAARDSLLAAMTANGNSAETATRASGGLLVSGVDVELIDDFLRRFENDRESILTDSRPIRKYIADRSTDELAQWDVLVASLKEDDQVQPKPTQGWPIRPLQRRVDNESLGRKLLAISGTKARVASRGVEKNGVTREAATRAELKFREEKGVSSDEPVNFPDRIYREARDRPLFILFNLGIKDADLDERARARMPTEPVVAWGISFPKSSRPDQKVEYVVNTVKLREMFGDDDADEDTGDED